jgi:hypothetical protein
MSRAQEQKVLELSIAFTGGLLATLIILIGLGIR